MSVEVEKETDEYRADTDRLTEFLNTVTTAGEYDDKVPSGWLRGQYNEWAVSMGFKPMNKNTFSDAMIERDYKKVKADGGYIHWRGLKQIITKIGDIDKPVSRETGEAKGGKREAKTLSRETGETIMDILNIYNNNGGSCDIESIREYIEKEISEKVSPVSPAIENASLNPPALLPGLPKSNDGPQIYLSKEQKTKIIEDVVKEYGKTPTKDNVMYIAGLVKKENDIYSPYEAAADIKNIYFPDKKTSQEANDKFKNKFKNGNGISQENKEKFEKDYPDVDFDDLCSRVQIYRQNGDNGNLRPIDNIEIMSKGFVSKVVGRQWEKNIGPVIRLFEIISERENNGGVPV